MKEATARIKVNKLLENASWRFFADANDPANIQLEPNVKLTPQELDALGVDQRNRTRGQKLRLLRPYQLRALRALIQAIKDGKDRFLFEMATGTSSSHKSRAH
jgi:type I site-specific restriction endonuclease